MRTTAVVCREQGKPFELEEIEIGPLREDEVLVRVVAAGVCHTDLICRDQWYPVPLPSVFGHEGSGVVEEVGSGVRKVKHGDHVVLTFASCGTCKPCQKGHPAYCAEFYVRNVTGGRVDGSSGLTGQGGRINGHFFGQSSWAGYSLATERNVVKVDQSAPLEMLGPLGCGIQTGSGAVFNVLRPLAGESIAVFGAGSVGLSAIMAAKAVGCTTIIAVDLKDHRLELAKELGATHGVNPSQVNTVEAIQDLTGGGVDYALEMTAVPAVFGDAVNSLATLGTVGVIGATALGVHYSFDLNGLMIPGKKVVGIVEGDSVPDVFIPRLVDLIEQGKFPVGRLVANYPMAEVNQAAADTENGVVVKPILLMG
ncbi:MAG TPA: NAD(P)-dependent alcohol dehydrogenase [Sporichthyaceae bacterium]|nr:NAD(P)-dependent alcohol dehydrogenase [Sporichthyaceae bacterium]